ncbi:unnamed protein product [Caenorhabditis angaria]|uniref:Uncharacterized protein n=1 Tax=Caenorhabditis angaria TaxID=860376 RepID=A0A9P1J2K3_9PELO|nr:unnamed protein product [Caenorhabditis angaria]
MIEISPNIWKTNETYYEASSIDYKKNLYAVIEYWKEIGTIETFDGITILSDMESMDNLFWDVFGKKIELCRYENIMSTTILIANNQVIIPELEIFTETDLDDLMLETMNKHRCAFTKPLLLKNGLVIDFVNNEAFNQKNVEKYRSKRDAHYEYETILSMVGPPFMTKPMIKTLFDADKISDIEKFQTNPIQNITILQEIYYWNVSQECFKMRSLMYQYEGNHTFGNQLIVLKCIRIAQYEARERERLKSKSKLDKIEEKFKEEIDKASFSLFDALLEKEFGKVEKILSSNFNPASIEIPFFNEQNVTNVMSLTMFSYEQDEITRYGFTTTPISYTTSSMPTTEIYPIHLTKTMKHTTSTLSKSAFLSTVSQKSIPTTTTQPSVKLNETHSIHQTTSVPTPTAQKRQQQTKTTSKPTAKCSPKPEFLSTILPKSTTTHTLVKIDKEKTLRSKHQVESVLTSTSGKIQKQTKTTLNTAITTTTAMSFTSKEIKENEKIIQQKTVYQKYELLDVSKSVYKKAKRKHQLFEIMLPIDETAAIRSHLNSNNIVARWIGDSLSITACQQVKPTKIYWNHQVNNTCYEHLPMKLENEQIWYKLPGSEDLIKHAKTKNCKVIREVYKKNGRWENSGGKYVEAGYFLNKNIQKPSSFSGPFKTYLEDEISYTPILKQKYSTMFSAKIIDHILEIDAAKLQDLIMEWKSETNKEVPFLIGLAVICLFFVTVTLWLIRKCLNGITKLRNQENIAKVISRVKTPRINQVNLEMETIERNDIFDEYPLPGLRR